MTPADTAVATRTTAAVASVRHHGGHRSRAPQPDTTAASTAGTASARNGMSARVCGAAFASAPIQADTQLASTHTTSAGMTTL